ncbi:MAG: hypothetical protein HZC47_11670 [Methanobacterium sp.]|uniref:hypothetical protein n=1 Tax=Methanobacterium sp. TaxID=2164 RepID=UPI0025DCEDD6|nr:hypothetical protein [Methanobacterium sp.]MBI5459744.1 hypothetical protein [Methanobacterium sp.]MBI5681543.1 hypothetical protein [Methanobacterium sp.]
MQKVNVRKIILNAVKTTEPTWKQYGIKWEDIDYLFIQRGYEQGGFNTSKFSELLIKEKIFSISKIGSILDNFEFNRTYNREFAGNYKSPFYLDLENGKAGEEGIGFYNSVRNFKRNKGSHYYQLLWWMLVCCNDLKHKYDASFSNYLLVKYSKFKNRSIDEIEFLTQSVDEWEQFKRTKPWNDLLGIGENVFDFLMGDLVDEGWEDREFVKDSYKLDDSNIRFLKVTGINNEPEHDVVVNYLKKLELPYTIRQTNKGIYSYCSETALKEVEEGVYQGDPQNHGFCHPNRCKECNVEDICEKDFSSLR